MDSKTHLDYALFQLTPTRTRCDLVVFCGSKKEKIASGLLEPFITHLGYAREQIPKGGYSITLRPGSPNLSWFTKGTLERFVRFVSHPEVLERFVTIQKEIEQIESSVVQSNEFSSIEAAAKAEEADNNTNKSIVPFKPKVEDEDNDGAVQEENAKVHLQRVLETRKAVLRKEQAMAYFRAFVAGYEMDCLDDLLAFADAFGASRLRDACMNFKELCYKKHNDGLWMDELAAMEAYVQPELPYSGTSGIVLTTENGNPSQNIIQSMLSAGIPNGNLERSVSGDVSESAASHASDVNQGQIPQTPSQSQYPWPNHLPPYMYNFPNQQMPPYQGYPFPNMHPSHYQGSMQWPPTPNRDAYGDGNREPSHHRNRKSSSKKKSYNGKESQTSEQDEHTEPSDSSSEGEEDEYLQPHKRKNGKKSSRTVVIRNINYITSKRKDEDNDSGESSLDEDEYIDGDSLKQRVEDAVGSLEKHKLNTRNHKKKGSKKPTANRSTDAEEGNGNENWGAFQNLLLKADDFVPNEIETHRTPDVRDEYFSIQSSESGAHFDASHAVVLESEQGIKRRVAATDSFVVTDRDNGNETGTPLGNFEEGENVRMSVKRRDYTDDELLFSQRNDDIGRNIKDNFSEGPTESSSIKTQRGEDWYIVNQPENSVSGNAPKEISIFDADKDLKLGNGYFERKDRNAFVDDSFMIQDRSFGDEQSGSQWRTDLSMVSGISVAPHHESDTPDQSGDKVGRSESFEPDDLYMMLDRDSGVEHGATWVPEVDYEMEISFTGRHQPDINVDDVVPDQSASVTTPETKVNGDAEKKPGNKKLVRKSKPEVISRPKKPSTFSRITMQRTKFETEEETRKRMEELVIERQKRIAERSAAKGSTPATSKKPPMEVKRRMSLPATQDTKKSSPTPNRFTSSTTTLKSTPSKKTSPKVNGEVAATLPTKTSTPSDTKDKDQTTVVVDAGPIASRESSLPMIEHSAKFDSSDDAVTTNIEGAITPKEPKYGKTPETIEEEITSDLIESTPPSITEHGLDQSHSRKKWTSDESSPSAKGFKKLLMFGRKVAA
ncbi:hypothetical protein ACHQM5_003029 [Ranunculus cassubicifolius]